MAVSAITYADFRPITIVTNGLNTLADVEAWIAEDADGAATALSQYMELVRDDVDIFAMAGSVEDEPSVTEVEQAAATSAQTLGMVTGEPGNLELRPTLELTRVTGDTFAAVAPTLLRDLSVGREVTVQDGTRVVAVTVTSRDESAESVTFDRALFTNRVYVRSMVVDDPERIANAYRFRRWLVTKDLQAEPTIQGFNPDLYRLLYLPTDGRLESMTNSELMSDYVSNPERVGNALDLERSVRNQEFTYIDVEDGIGMGPGAGVAFANGRVISGVFTSPSVQTVPVAAELSDALAVTPAALAAVVAREKAILLEHVEAERVSVGEGGLSVAGRTLVKGDIVAEKSIRALGHINTLSDVYVSGGVTCNKSIAVGGLSELNGGAIVSGGADIRDGVTIDSLMVVDGCELQGTVHVDTVIAGEVESSGVRSDSVHVDLLKGSKAYLQEVTTETANVTGNLIAQGFQAGVGKFVSLEVDDSLTAGHLQVRTADLARAIVTDLEANGAFLEALTAKVVAALFLESDKVVTRELTASEASASTLRAVHAQIGTMCANSVRTPEADVDTLLATRASVMNTFQAPSIRADHARLDRLEAELASIRELVADRVEAPIITATCNLEAPNVRTDTMTAGSVEIDAANIDSLHAGSTEIEHLRARDVHAEVVYAQSGEVPNMTVDRLYGSSIDVEQVNTEGVEADTVVCTGRAAVATLEAEALKLRTGEVQNLKADFLCAGQLHTDEVNTRHMCIETIDINKQLVSHNARVDNLAVTDAHLEAVSSKYADLESTNVTELTARVIATQSLQADSIDTRTVKTHTFEGTIADIDLAQVACLEAESISAGMVVADKLQTSTVSMQTTHTTSLDTDQAGILRANIDKASIDTLTVRDAAVAVLDAGRLTTGSLSTEKLEVVGLDASEADIKTLRAGGMVLTGGGLDTTSGETVMGAASATLLRVEESHVMTLSADKLSVRDARADTLTVAEALKGRAVMADDLSCLEMSTDQAQVRDLRVSGHCDLYGNVHFNEPVLRLPIHVECADTLLAPTGLIGSVSTKRIAIGR